MKCYICNRVIHGEEEIDSDLMQICFCDRCQAEIEDNLNLIQQQVNANERY